MGIMGFCAALCWFSIRELVRHKIRTTRGKAVDETEIMMGRKPIVETSESSNKETSPRRERKQMFRGSCATAMKVCCDVIMFRMAKSFIWTVVAATCQGRKKFVACRGKSICGMVPPVRGRPR